ncbi:MAG: hypothetical protein KAW41_06230 [Candidatus Diapherotrites archaeon]|nr:hypothetical protein [Candidatus Diapherotrites archaeon]
MAVSKFDWSSVDLEGPEAVGRIAENVSLREIDKHLEAGNEALRNSEGAGVQAVLAAAFGGVDEVNAANLPKAVEGVAEGRAKLKRIMGVLSEARERREEVVASDARRYARENDLFSVHKKLNSVEEALLGTRGGQAADAEVIQRSNMHRVFMQRLAEEKAVPVAGGVALARLREMDAALERDVKRFRRGRLDKALERAAGFQGLVRQRIELTEKASVLKSPKRSTGKKRGFVMAQPKEKPRK